MENCQTVEVLSKTPSRLRHLNALHSQQTAVLLKVHREYSDDDKCKP